MATRADNAPATRPRSGARARDAHAAMASPSGGTRMGTRPSATNVARDERYASVIGGAALAVYGARRRDLPGALLALLGGYLVRRGATGRCEVYDALGVSTVDARGAIGLRRQHGEAAVLDAARAIKIERTVTVGRPADELYRFWRSFENLPRVMDHLESVTVVDGKRSHWVAKAPAGTTVEWDAEIHNEVPNELIAWRSVHEASVPNAGSVHFRAAPGGRGTEVKVVLEYEPPAGRFAAIVARLFGEEPDVQVREDLRRFKMMMETGEAASTEGQSRGR